MAARKRKRPKHLVRGTLDVPRLAKAGSSLTLELFSDDHKLGKLVIGRGSLFWTGKGKHRSKRIAWSRFAEFMNKIAYGD